MRILLLYNGQSRKFTYIGVYKCFWVNYFPEKNLLILKAENSKYEDLVYTGEQLDHIIILGKAVAFQSDVR